jgi:nucleotide-binding universal stress UspA family protein
MTCGRVTRVLTTVVLVLALASCSHGSSHKGASAASTTAPRTEVLVTVGSDATFGIGLDDPLSDSWPQLLYHQAFPQSTVLVNAAERAVTVNTAASEEVPLALEEHATVVAVWIGDVDLATGIPAVAFESSLDALVKRLRDAGARVLLGNLSTAQPGALAYDNAIASVARDRGATLVDLAGALSATPNIGPSSSITKPASTQIAEAFSVAIART